MSRWLLSLALWIFPLPLDCFAKEERSSSEENAADQVNFFEAVSRQSTQKIRESFQYGSAGKSWGDALTRWTPSGRSYVGSGISGESIRFQTNGLPEHTGALVRIKCFIIYHWDGNWTVYGPDTFRVQLDDEQELLRASFSNFTMVGQSYPDTWPWGRHSARSGAAETGTLGWKFPGGWGQPLDAVYEMSFGVARSGSAMTLDFRGDFHDSRDPQHLRGEQWGIESLEIDLFNGPVELAANVWDTLAKNLLSADVAEFTEAKALLPLGHQKTVIRALNAAAARHGLDHETLKAKSETEPSENAILADVLQRAVNELRSRENDAQQAEPTKSVRAARLYEVLKLMNGGGLWQQLLWDEIHRDRH